MSKRIDELELIANMNEGDLIPLQTSSGTKSFDLGKVNTKITKMATDLGTLNNKVTNNLSPEINALTNKVSGLETATDNLSVSIQNLENKTSNNEASIQNAQNTVSNLQQVTDNLVVSIDSFKDKYSLVSVYDYGIKEGYDVNVEENTANFQRMIDECKDTKIIVFPAGNFVFNEVNLGEKSNVVIHGFSSNFASLANKNIYTGALRDTFTRIICNAEPGKTFFNHQACILVLENIGFYNLKKNESGKFIEEEAKTNVLMQHTVDDKYTKNLGKGKVFCTNCGFFGWKVVFGGEYTFQHLEDAWNTGKTREDYDFIKQSCVVANRCRFTRNGIAINQTVDGRIVDCSFNKNDYAIVFRENSGFSTIDSCRIEWNIYNGIYCDKAHEVLISNTEYDCNGYAGLYATGNTNSNFNGIFRRSGANVETSDESKSDYVNNVHIYADGNYNCNFIGNNTTAKPISDVGSAPERPSNATCFTNNVECIVSLNNFCGCTKGDKNDANKFENNVDCIIKDNIKLNDIQ